MLRAEITADHDSAPGDSTSAEHELDTKPSIAVTVGAGGVTGLLASAGLLGMVLLGLLVAVMISLDEEAPSGSAAPHQVAPHVITASAPPKAESFFVSAADLRRWQNDGEEVLLWDAREPPQWGAPLHIQNTSCALPWKSLSRWEEGGADKSVLLPVSLLQQQLRQCGLRRDRTQRVVVYGDWAAAWGEEGRLFWTLEYLSAANEGRVYVLRGGFAGWQAAFPQQVSATLSGVSAGDFVAAEQPRRRLLKPQITAALTSRSGSTDGNSATGLPSRRLRLLDSREPQEYTGTIDPYGVARAGHVPGAISFPWKTVFATPAAPVAGDTVEAEADVGTWPDLLPCDTLRTRFLEALQRPLEDDGPEVPTVVEVGTYCTGERNSSISSISSISVVLRRCIWSRKLTLCTPQIMVCAQVESAPVSCTLCCGSASPTTVLLCKWSLRTTMARCGSGQMTPRLRWPLATRPVAALLRNNKGVEQRENNACILARALSL